MNNDAISRSAVIDRLEIFRTNYTLKAGYRDAMTDAIGEVRVAPALDVAPVVRCKDCKRAIPITNPLIINALEGKAMACSIWRGTLCCGLSVVTPNEYCSDGVRMDGEPDA